MSSAEEAEVGGLLHNNKDDKTIIITLEETGHTQPATPMNTDNFTAKEIVSNRVQKKHNKAMDMRFYWVQDIIHH